MSPVSHLKIVASEKIFVTFVVFVIGRDPEIASFGKAAVDGLVISQFFAHCVIGVGITVEYDVPAFFLAVEYAVFFFSYLIARMEMFEMRTAYAGYDRNGRMHNV